MIPVRTSAPRMSILAASLSLVIAAAAGGAEAQARTDSTGGAGGGPISGSLHVRVVLDGTSDPVAGAFVMVGSREGDPFDGNWGLTTAAGEITFADPSLAGPVTVTAGAAGTRYLSVVSVDAADLVLPLAPIAPPGPLYEVGDYVSGIDVDDGWFHSGDGNLDMAFVFPALDAGDLMAFDMGGLLGPPDTIDILGTPVAIPSNVFLPPQYEAFTLIVKDHYSLFLPAGDYTLAALSVRVALADLLGGGDLADILPLLDWRETDLLDAAVAGDTQGADLFVDPDLVSGVSLTVGNLPDSSTATCLSAGDLDGANGLGRIVTLGMSAVACPGGAGGCGGTVSLTTTAPVGEFAGTGFFPAVAVGSDSSDDLLLAMVRGTHGPSYSETIDDFFLELNLGDANGTLFWNDVENTGAGSPAVDLHLAAIENGAGDSTFWEFLVPGDAFDLTPPWLPGAAPPGPVEGAPYTWKQTSVGLGYDPVPFDFNDFAFSDIAAHASHLAADKRTILFGSIATGIARSGAPAALAIEGSRPNPFNPRAAIRFALPGESAVRLSVYDAGGRRVATLVDALLPAGSHEAVWEGRDERGRAAPSGVYFARLETEGIGATTKLVLVR